MSWVADHEIRRTYDVDAGLELFFLSGGSDGSRSFEIRGNDFLLQFSASTIDAPATAEESAKWNMSDAMVWCVWGKPTNWNPEERALIIGALCATKGGHGFNIRGEPYFVRFGLKGELQTGESQAGPEAGMSDETLAEPRRLSPLLAFGILLVPGLFVWFTLRRGYSTALRVGAFSYAAFVVGTALFYNMSH